MERERFLEESEHHCPFCDIVKKDIPRRGDVIASTPHFTAIIDIAPPVENYFVIFPKEHALSYFELTPEIEEEYNAVIADISNKTGQKEWIAFENGAGNRKGGDYGIVSYQSVYHCHMNYVGVPEGQSDLWKFIEGRFDSLVKKEGGLVYLRDTNVNKRYPVSELREHTTGEPYFFQQMGTNVRIVKETTEDKIVPSQFVRKAITQYIERDLDTPFWDWKNIDPVYQARIEERRQAMLSKFR